MTLSGRDRRALYILGGALLLGGVLYWFSNSSSSSSAVTTPLTIAPAQSIDQAQRRLATLRKQAATLPGKEAVLKQVSLELADREKALIPGDTAERAQAGVLEIGRRGA